MSASDTLKTAAEPRSLDAVSRDAAAVADLLLASGAYAEADDEQIAHLLSAAIRLYAAKWQHTGGTSRATSPRAGGTATCWCGWS